MSGSARPSRPMRSASRSEPRRRRSGQSPSWTPGDDHEPPLQALGAVRGHQPYGVGAYGAAGEGVGGDVLGVDLLQEVEGAAAAGALLGAGRGRRTGRTRRRGRGRRCGRPRRRAARPAPGGCGQGVPSHSSHSASSAVPPPARSSRALRSSAPSRWAPRAYAGSCATSRSGSARARASSTSEGGGTRFARGALLLAQGPAEAAQVGGVHAAERRGEQGERGLGVEPGGGACGGSSDGCRGAAASARRLRRRSRASATRSGSGRLARRRPRRSGAVGVRSAAVPPPAAPSAAGPPRARGAAARSSPSMSSGTPAEVSARRTAGMRAAARADQDGHLAPGHAVLQVGAAQDVGDVVQLGAGRRIGVRLHAAAVRGPAASSRWARTFSAGSRVSGIRRVSSRVAASSPAPERREVRQDLDRGGRRPRARKASGKSRMPFTSAPRKA